jgi:hypothetical protein
MRIGELGRRTGVNAHQLRYYEAQGLLEADRGTNGYREYDENAYLLPCAVGEAPELLGCPELLAAMRSRLRRLDDQMAALARSRNALADYIDAAERVSDRTYPPFDDADPERVPA